jgi:hypothetical protein
MQKPLQKALGLLIWLVLGFLIWKGLGFTATELHRNAADQNGSAEGQASCSGLPQALAASINQVRDSTWAVTIIVVVWVLAIIPLWLWSDRFRRLCSWLVCDDEAFAAGKTDGTAAFSTLAAFALAQGAALTVVAKGRDRDNLVLLIYAIAVAFSYAWTRQTLLSRKDAAVDVPFDTTTVQYGKYSLAWIVFLGAIMFTLGCYGLLPNQTWRDGYTRVGRIRCVTKLANNYATTEATDKLVQAQRKWIKWAAASQGAGNNLYWIETEGGFEGNYLPFQVDFQAQPRFTRMEAVAFLKHQASASSMPEFRELSVQQPEVDTKPAAQQQTTSGPWTITVTDANTDDHLVVLCVAKDTAVHGTTQPKLDAAESFWLVPVFGDRRTQ